MVITLVGSSTTFLPTHKNLFFCWGLLAEERGKKGAHTHKKSERTSFRLRGADSKKTLVDKNILKKIARGKKNDDCGFQFFCVFVTECFFSVARCP